MNHVSSVQVKDLKSLDGGRGKRFKATVVRLDPKGALISSKPDFVERIGNGRYRTKNGTIAIEAKA